MFLTLMLGATTVSADKRGAEHEFTKTISLASLKSIKVNTTAPQYKNVVDSEKEAPTNAEQLRLNEDADWRPGTVWEYFEKGGIDFITSPTFWLFLIVVGMLIRFRDETKGIIKSLQSVKIGPVELVRAAIDEIKAEITEGNLRFQVKQDEIAISDFIAYPQKIDSLELLDLFFKVNWQKEMVRLGILEARLAVQEDRIRSSPHFDEDKASARLRFR